MLQIPTFPKKEPKCLVLALYVENFGNPFVRNWFYDDLYYILPSNPLKLLIQQYTLLWVFELILVKSDRIWSVCLVSREDNHSLEFQGSLKLTLKFKVQSMSRWPVQKISRFFKVEGNWKISRGKWSWPWKTLNFKARTRVYISRELHIKARVEWF